MSAPKNRCFEGSSLSNVFSIFIWSTKLDITNKEMTCFWHEILLTFDLRKFHCDKCCGPSFLAMLAVSPAASVIKTLLHFISATYYKINLFGRFSARYLILCGVDCCTFSYLDRTADLCSCHMTFKSNCCPSTYQQFSSYLVSKQWQRSFYRQRCWCGLSEIFRFRKIFVSAFRSKHYS